MDSSSMSLANDASTATISVNQGPLPSDQVELVVRALSACYSTLDQSTTSTSNEDFVEMLLATNITHLLSNLYDSITVHQPRHVLTISLLNRLLIQLGLHPTTHASRFVSLMDCQRLIVKQYCQMSDRVVREPPRVTVRHVINKIHEQSVAIQSQEKQETPPPRPPRASALYVNGSQFSTLQRPSKQNRGQPSNKFATLSRIHRKAVICEDEAEDELVVDKAKYEAMQRRMAAQQCEIETLRAIVRSLTEEVKQAGIQAITANIVGPTAREFNDNDSDLNSVSSMVSSQNHSLMTENSLHRLRGTLKQLQPMLDQMRKTQNGHHQQRPTSSAGASGCVRLELPRSAAADSGCMSDAEGDHQSIVSRPPALAPVVCLNDDLDCTDNEDTIHSGCESLSSSDGEDVTTTITIQTSKKSIDKHALRSLADQLADAEVQLAKCLT